MTRTTKVALGVGAVGAFLLSPTLAAVAVVVGFPVAALVYLSRKGQGGSPRGG